MANSGTATANGLFRSEELGRSLAQTGSQSQAMLDAIAQLASKGSEQAAAAEQMAASVE
jgi:hypothetical protein